MFDPSKLNIGYMYSKFSEYFDELVKSGEIENSVKKSEYVNLLIERISRYIDERNSKIKDLFNSQSGKEVVNPAYKNFANSYMCLHLVPIADHISEAPLEISKIDSKSNHIKLFENELPNAHELSDGCKVSAKNEEYINYTHVFTNKCIESVTSMVIFRTKYQLKNSSSNKVLDREFIFNYFDLILCAHMKLQHELNILPPTLMQISFFGMKDVVLYKHQDPGRDYESAPYESSELHLPPTIIKDFHEEFKNRTVIANQLKDLWLIFGEEECLWVKNLKSVEF